MGWIRDKAGKPKLSTRKSTAPRSIILVTGTSYRRRALTGVSQHLVILSATCQKPNPSGSTIHINKI